MNLNNEYNNEYNNEQLAAIVKKFDVLPTDYVVQSDKRLPNILTNKFKLLKQKILKLKDFLYDNRNN